MTYEISAKDMGWMDSDKDYSVDDVTVTVNVNPDDLTPQQWEEIAAWFDETFPLTDDEVSHGFVRNAGTYTFEIAESQWIRDIFANAKQR